MTTQQELADGSTGQTGSPTAAVLCIGAAPERWTASIVALSRQGVPVVAVLHSGVRLGGELEQLEGVEVVAGALAHAVERARAAATRSVFVATAPVVVPDDAFVSANALLERDVRIASVSFLSNAANYLSFPHRNRPSWLVAGGHNENTLTQLLRQVPTPTGTPVPLGAPAGAGILLSAEVLDWLPGPDPTAPDPETALIDFALRAARRGLVNVLDATTFITRPLVADFGGDAHNDPYRAGWLTVRHAGFTTAFERDRDDADSALGNVLEYYRASVTGLRIAIDAGCLGPYEMGTQVAVLSQIEALAAHPQVNKIYVGTPDGSVPGYAARVLGDPKIVVCAEAGGTFPGVHDVDIVHRPFQPTGPLPFDHWRRIARRSVLTVQDLIAYENSSYFDQPSQWQDYRSSMRRAVAEVDSVVAISRDTRRSIKDAWLPVPDEAISVIENGTDHLRPRDGATTPPQAMLTAGGAAAPFILVLGAAYSHKNRDLAIRAWHELRRRGSSARLVLAGAVVPFGSTRDAEALVTIGAERPIVLPDVTSAERDWLLEHADVVLYPTSAEGFGLVPFEAAVFGTPCAFVSFGPLAEVLPEVPYSATGWAPERIADVVEVLQTDVDAAKAQVEAVLTSASRMTWERYADLLVSTYLQTLGRPRLSAAAS